MPINKLFIVYIQIGIGLGQGKNNSVIFFLKKFDDVNYSHKKRKNSPEGSLDRVLSPET